MSSVLNNATYHPGLRALTSLQPSKNISIQKLNVLLRTASLRYSGNSTRHHTNLIDDRAAASKRLPQRESLPSSAPDESLQYWIELHRRALRTFIPNATDKISKPTTDAVRNAGLQNGRRVQTASSYPGRRITKPHSRSCRYKRPSRITEKDSLQSTLLQSFPHLNYETSSSSLSETHQTSDSLTGHRVEKSSSSRVLRDYLRSLGTQPLHDELPYEAKEANRLSRVFTLKASRILSMEGYTAEEVVAWAWILTAQESFRAALRLFFWDRQDSSRRRTPLFVVELLLRRASLDVRAFRILLIYSLSYLTQRPLTTIASATGSDVSEFLEATPVEPQATYIKPENAEVLVKTLLKRARQLWPAAQFHIAQAYAYYLIHLTPQSRKLREDGWPLNILRAKYFNSCLSALGIPSKHSPFISASIQQRAQFELLKAMAAHEPVLPVSRRGYQAVIAVQLAHMKTPAEKIFAEQKALSWPPWKEARMGIDSDRGHEGMRSRTMQVLSQMTEAGYSHTAWEGVAGILGGWDTDGSPTIQTRSLATPPNFLPTEGHHIRMESEIWVARIRATRTLREAWACFLSYKARCDVPSERAYHAIAKKIIYSQALTRASDNIFSKMGPLPGDGLEVFPEPSSARDIIYVPSEPPSIEDLLREMMLHGVRPSDDFVALLLSTSSNFSTGVNYLCAFLGAKRTGVLLTLYTGEVKNEALKVLQKLKPRLFDSFIVFLCTHADSQCLGHRIRKADLFPILMQSPHSVPAMNTLVPHEWIPCDGHEDGHPQILSHAVKLLKTVKPRRVSSWLPLLQALASLRGPTTERAIKPDVQRFLAWYELGEAIRWMQEMELEPGMEGLTLLCQAFSQAVIAGVKDATVAEEGLYFVNRSQRYNDELKLNVAANFEDFIYQGLQVLKTYFDRLVYPMPLTALIEVRNPHYSLDEKEPASVDLPDMLQVPNPSTLHAFVRALGAAEDHDGILNLLHWMSRYASEIIERANQRGNGRRMLRRTLTAIRVFLEGSKEDKMSRPDFEPSATKYKSPLAEYDHSNDDDYPKTHPVFFDGRVEEAYKLVENTDGWGPWPTDDEVRAYILQHTGHD